MIVATILSNTAVFPFKTAVNLRIEFDSSAAEQEVQKLFRYVGGNFYLAGDFCPNMNSAPTGFQTNQTRPCSVPLHSSISFRVLTIQITERTTALPLSAPMNI